MHLLLLAYRHYPKGLHGINSIMSYMPLLCLIGTVNWVNLMASSCKRSSMKPMRIAKQQVSASEGEYKKSGSPTLDPEFINPSLFFPFFPSSWTGSVYFSSLIRTPASRNLFANNLLILVKKYNLDGLNLDWGKHPAKIPPAL